MPSEADPMTFSRRPVAEHRARAAALLASIPAKSERVDLADLATGRRQALAVDLFAAGDLPAFDNSQMDGFAIRTADVRTAAAESAVTLTVSGHVAAGDAGMNLAAGHAAAVMTGAPLPRGADAVIPIEDSGLPAFPRPDEPATLVLTAPVPAGRFVRERGSDIARGGRIATADSPITPALVGTIAASGLRHVDVRRPLSVLVVATGSELRRADDRDRPGSILDANTLMLTALLTGVGARVLPQEFVPDDAEALLRVLDSFVGHADLVVTAGGVSKGAHEVVRECLTGRGVDFGSVAMQPGGPQGIGTARLPSGDIPTICLPGNPVSALVSAEMFLRPALAPLIGRLPDRPAIRGRLTAAVDSPAGVLQVRRGRLGPGDVVELIGGPSSHLLSAFARSNLLVFIPPDVTQVPAGTTVDAWRIDD